MFQTASQASSHATFTRPPRRRGVGSPAALGLVGLSLEGMAITAEAGETLYAQEDAADYIYQVSLGCVRTVSLQSDGRRIVHGFHLAGEIFGMEREETHRCSAEAVCETRVVRCDRNGLQALADDNPEAAGQLWSWLLLHRDRAAERYLFLTHAGAFDKVAYFLLDMAWRTAQPSRVQLPMSRYDIGDYLGLSSETVSRVFTLLRVKGLIATEGRTVILLNPRLMRRGDREPSLGMGLTGERHA